MDASRDALERRCPRLGGPVSFSYCRKGDNSETVCWKIFDCWWESFDVVGHLQACLPADKFEMIVKARPKPKIQSIVELVEQAKKRIEEAAK
jgi:hypothetical protein